MASEESKDEKIDTKEVEIKSPSPSKIKKQSSASSQQSKKSLKKQLINERREKGLEEKRKALVFKKEND